MDRSYIPIDSGFHDYTLSELSLEKDAVRLKVHLNNSKYMLTISEPYCFVASSIKLSNQIEGVYFEEIGGRERCGHVIEEVRTYSNRSELMGDADKIAEQILGRGLGVLAIEFHDGAWVMSICDRGQFEYTRVDQSE